MWAYTVMIGFLIVACFFVLTPLLREDGRKEDPEAKRSDLMEALKAKKDAAYAAIREMEFDFNMGKLTEEDLAFLKRQYLAEAAGYMKELDALAEGGGSDTAPEDVRTTDEKQDKDAAGAGRAMEPPPEKDVYCTSCGKKAALDNRFCTACGASLKPGRSGG